MEKKCKETPIYFMISKRVNMMRNCRWIIAPNVETQRRWKQAIGGVAATIASIDVIYIVVGIVMWS